MGAFFTRNTSEKWLEDEPDCRKPSVYHPQFGFDGRRPKRVIESTKEEMDSAGIIGFNRDYCVKLRMETLACYWHNAPFIRSCRGLRNELEDCYLDDRIIAMKEFEREKRLNVRERRLRAQSLE